MKNVRSRVLICVSLALTGALLYGAQQVIRNLFDWQRFVLSPERIVALAGAAGVVIGITCFRTMDRTLYLGPEREDQIIL